jgi:hypothetical protein
MGIGSVVLRDLIELKRGGWLDDVTNLVEIGDQQLSDAFITSPDFPEIFRLFGRLAPPLHPVGENNFHLAPTSSAFWNALGIKRTAVDLVGDAVRIDLNSGRVPRAMRKRFDLLINTGTTEHVINQLNAFSIMHDLCRPGAVMYHELPAGGLIDHGFFAYQPKFFQYLSEANGYTIIFSNYWTYQGAPLPEYLRKPIVQHDIPDCVLRVALRKSGSGRFVVPMDMPEQPTNGTRGLARRALPYVRRLFGRAGA